jgi:SNF2-related domain/Helicase conserved C-terminal domain
MICAGASPYQLFTPTQFAQEVASHPQKTQGKVAPKKLSGPDSHLYMSQPPINKLDFSAIELALKGFGITVANAGRRLFEQGQVKSLRETDRLNTFEGDVRDQGANYQVTLAYGRSAASLGRDESKWNLLCTCRIGSECRHVYATLLFLSKRFVKETIATQKRESSEEDTFFDLVSNPRQLTERETDFIERLEDLYRTHQDGGEITGRALRALFSSWPEPEYWDNLDLAPRIKLSLQQFWHFLVVNLETRAIPAPTIFGKANDTTASAALIADWKNAQAEAVWKARYERQDEPPVHRPLDSELRWLIDGHELRLELKKTDESEFRPILPDELQRMIIDWRGGRLQLPADSLLLLLQHTLADAFQPPIRLQINPALAARLNPLLRLPEIRSRICRTDGSFLEFATGTTAWEVETPSPSVYRFELRTNGRPIDAPVLVFPGSTTLYLAGSTIFEASPPPFPLDSLECPPSAEIPRGVIESVPGIRFLARIMKRFPEPLEQRITRVRPKRVIRVLLEPEQPGISFTTHLIDPKTGQSLNQGPESPWTLSGNPIFQEGDRFVCYEAGDPDEFHRLLTGLPVLFDRTQGHWRIRSPKHSLHLFAKWRHALPDDIQVEVPEPLSGLNERPVEIDLSLEWSEQENDWFDLRLSWSNSELQLTPEELRALLDAQDKTVVIASQGHRLFHIRRPERVLSVLNELGIAPQTLAEAPQRLHLLHLNRLPGPELVPDGIRQTIEKRLADINTQVTPNVPRSVQVELRPYQITGFHFLAYLGTNQFGGILADDMGLGKTLQTLAWLSWLRETTSTTCPSLVVCPKSVVDNWLSETQRFCPSIPISALPRTQLDQKKLKPGNVLVLNYAQLRILGDELKEVDWEAIIFDEGQYLKNTTSQTTRTAWELQAKHKILLTGTPIENKLLDLWSLMHCVMPGALGTQNEFKRNFSESGDQDCRSRLARRVRPFILRRTKEEVALELPPKIEEDIRASMEGEQEDLYQAELKLARQHLLKITSEEQLHQERFNLLTSLLRLRQICCHPALVNPKKDTVGSAKLEALVDLLEPLIEEGNKILVFSQFVEMLKLIRHRVTRHQWPSFMLTGETENRGQLIEEFQNHQGAGLFLISLRAGGAGLNLAAASYVILFDPWWNPAVENQATDRVHRIGQTKTVFAYRLLIRDSIEDKIRQLQVRKSKLAKDVLGEEAFANALTLEDFKYVLE